MSSPVKVFQDREVYVLVNMHQGGALELDQDTMEVAITPLTGAPTQQWRIQVVRGRLYELINMATECHFLGLKRGTVATTGATVVGTRDPFLWSLDYDPEGWCRLSVPNLGQQLEITLDWWTRWAFPNKPAKLSGSNVPVHLNWRWRLENPDVQRPVRSGALYKIVGEPSGTVLHLKDSGRVVGYPYNEGRNQLWRAVVEDDRYPFIVGFQNYRTGQHLAIYRDSPSSGTTCGTRLVGNESYFAWHLVRDVSEPRGYRLFVPYSPMGIDLHNGRAVADTPVHLYNSIAGKYWKFEEVGVPVLVPSTEICPGPSE